MIPKIKPRIPIGINIDFYHFYPSISTYLTGTLGFAKKHIRSDLMGEITDIVFDWLLNRVKNFTVTPCPWSWRLYRYFDKEDALEIFDPLFLDFLEFLREKGIRAGGHYEVKRGKQCRCTCIETDKVTPNYQ